MTDTTSSDVKTSDDSENPHLVPSSDDDDDDDDDDVVDNYKCECDLIADEAMELIDWLRITVLEFMERKPRAVNAILEIFREEMEGSMIPHMERLLYDMEDGNEEEALCQHNHGCYAQQHKNVAAVAVAIAAASKKNKKKIE